MLIVETIAKIRRAYFVQGKAIKAICRELGVSRKVVRKVLRSGATEFAYERRVQRQGRMGEVEVRRLRDAPKLRLVRTGVEVGAKVHATRGVLPDAEGRLHRHAEADGSLGQLVALAHATARVVGTGRGPTPQAAHPGDLTGIGEPTGGLLALLRERQGRRMYRDVQRRMVTVKGEELAAGGRTLPASRRDLERDRRRFTSPCPHLREGGTDRLAQDPLRPGRRAKAGRRPSGDRLDPGSSGAGEPAGHVTGGGRRGLLPVSWTRR